MVSTALKIVTEKSIGNHTGTKAAQAQALSTQSFSKMNLALLGLLIYFSWGAYLPFWFARRGTAINSLRSTLKLSPIAVGSAVALILLEIAALRSQMGQVLLLGFFGIWAIQVHCSIRVKAILEDHLTNVLGRNYRLSRVSAVLLGPLYLQWKINQIQAGRI